MTEFNFGTYRLQVDVEKTRAWYGTYGQIAGGCDCGYCRNFAAVVSFFPDEVEEFLERFGLTLQKSVEVMECCRELDE